QSEQQLLVPTPLHTLQPVQSQAFYTPANAPPGPQISHAEEAKKLLIKFLEGERETLSVKSDPNVQEREKLVKKSDSVPREDAKRLVDLLCNPLKDVVPLSGSSIDPLDESINNVALGRRNPPANFVPSSAASLD
ncbi:hypothetical protein PFISCL1PPCAC_28034, partial [Pristionchus fissidentatus]